MVSVQCTYNCVCLFSPVLLHTFFSSFPLAISSIASSCMLVLLYHFTTFGVQYSLTLMLLLFHFDINCKCVKWTSKCGRGIWAGGKGVCEEEMKCTKKKSKPKNWKKWGKVNFVLCVSVLNYTHAYWIKWLCKRKEELLTLFLFPTKKKSWNSNAQQIQKRVQKLYQNDHDYYGVVVMRWWSSKIKEKLSRKNVMLRYMFREWKKICDHQKTSIENDT